VVRVWRMLYEHVVKASRLGRFLFIGKVTMVSRFVKASLFVFKHASDFISVCVIQSLSSGYSLNASTLWQLIYEKLPQDISDRHVLLLDPILGTGLCFSL
jgi:uracil phosphoribosyltransferase